MMHYLKKHDVTANDTLGASACMLYVVGRLRHDALRFVENKYWLYYFASSRTRVPVFKARSRA